MTNDQVRLPRDLPSLTSLRAFAALIVFAYHLSRWNVLPFPFSGLGTTGVAFFFVLSGFLLAWGHAERLQVRRFYVRRFARIWPAHAVAWAAALLLPVTTYPVTAATAVPNLLLLQAWIPTERYVFGVNGVAWSLSCEIAFYAAFPLVVAWLSRRTLRTAVLVAACAFGAEAVFAVLVSLPGVPSWIALAGFAHPLVRLPEFVLGIVAARAVRTGWRPRAAVVGTVVLVCAAGLAVFHARPAPNVWTAPVFALVIVLAASRDCAGRRSWWAAGPLVYAGKVSFAFYLVHELVILNLGPELPRGPVGALVLFAVGCGCAVLLHHAVELPAQGFIVRRLHSAGRPTPSDPVAR